MISVITPTYNNARYLYHAMETLEAQTFKDWQHVVIADGPDPGLRMEMRKKGYKAHGKRVFLELGRNWHGFMGGDSAPVKEGHPGTRGGRGSRGASVALAGSYLAGGDRIAYLDADCEYLPDHLGLANAVLDQGVDFSYSQMQRCLDGQPWDVIGNGTPAYGAIDCNAVVHKAELFKIANWRWGGDSDWDILAHWLDAGASYGFVPSVTVRWHHARFDV